MSWRKVEQLYAGPYICLLKAGGQKKEGRRYEADRACAVKLRNACFAEMSSREQKKQEQVAMSIFIYPVCAPTAPPPYTSPHPTQTQAGIQASIVTVMSGGWKEKM